VAPVLLNPATGITAAQEYSWSWEPALDKLRIPWCAYTAPHHTLDDIQTSGEYIVYAIRTMYALAHRPIDILGHSQGGMSMRWALRFWPDTRAMVDDVVGIAGTNHGTTVGGPAMCLLGCPAADWQQFAGSNFVGALNSGAETFAGISYTEIYTHKDEVVQPDSSPSKCTSCLHTGAGQITNVATQDICPHDYYEHLGVGPVDPVAYAIAVDALAHPGPAAPGRIPHSVCLKLFMPGVDLLHLNTELQLLATQPGLLSVAVGPLAPLTTGAPAIKAEPPLACYVFAACPAGAGSHR
jgi:pimeloyl-ACP methyl ester carboxylesterase